MRELKFRAYDPATEEYIYSDKIAGGMWRYFKTLEDRGIRHFESEQYIGRVDSNNKEIYKGDILQLNDDKLIVEWCDKEAYFGLTEIPRIDRMNPIQTDDWSMLTIIGNINQNPELLEGKK